MADDHTTYVPGQPFKGTKRKNIRGSTYAPFTEEYNTWIENRNTYLFKNQDFLPKGKVGGFDVGVENMTQKDADSFSGNLVLSEDAAKSLIDQADKIESLEDYNTFFQQNAEVFQFMDPDDFAAIQKDFEEKKSGFSESFIREQLKDEVDPNAEKGDALLYKAVQQGKYLPHRVAGNIMDDYQVPMYYLRFFVMKKDAVKEMHANLDETAVEKITYKITPPDPNDIVVIAETGATDLTIDDLEIEHFKEGIDRFATTSFSWTITEPGSITLLDRLAAARNFCGYVTTDGSAKGESQTGNIPAANGIPYFLEVSLKGFKDDVNDVDEGSGTAEHIIGPYIYELGYIKFDMNIGPEGAVYNFSAHPKDNVAKFSTYNRTNGAFDVTGESITQLLKSLEEGINSSNIKAFEDLNVPESELPKYSLNYEGLVKNPFYGNETIRKGEYRGQSYEGRIEFYNANDRPGQDELRDRVATGYYEDIGEIGYDENYSPDGIDNFLYIDPDKVNAKGTVYNPVGEGDNIESTYTNEYGIGITSGVGNDVVNTLYGDTDRLQYMIRSKMESEDDDEVRLSPEEMDEIRTILSVPQYVTIRVKKGTVIQDIVESIMSLSYDLVNKATRLQDPENPDGEVNKEQAFVNWYTITETVNYDYDNYSEKLGTYVPSLEYRIRLTKEARTDVGLSPKELNINLNKEEMATRIMDLGIAKEYLYYFTGLNDQIITLDMSFNEAFALKAPVFGRQDFKAQLAYASANDISMDEVDDITLNPSVFNANDTERQKEKANDFLKEISGVLSGGGEAADSLRNSISTIADEMYLGGAYGNGDAVAEAITGKNQELKTEFAQKLAQTDLGRQIVNASLVKSKITPQANTSTSSDQTSTEGDSTVAVNNVPLFASEIFPGLEGMTDDPRVAEEYASQLDDFIATKMQVVATQGTHSMQLGPVADVERGSIRATSFAHLMNAYRSGAVSNLKINMELRGDPWYMGKGNFYDGNNDEGTENDTPVSEYTDLLGAAYNSGSNQFLLMIESPRKLDFDITDEDQNTGFYNFGHLNYTMSGIYMVTRAMSKFSDGMYTNDIEAVKMPGYETAKIESVRKVVEGKLQRDIDNIGKTMKVGTGGTEDLPPNIPAEGEGD